MSCDHKHLDDISVLRLLCILVVVFFHCYQMMWAPAHFPHVSAVYKDLYFLPIQCGIINVAMPLFVFISGYLFIYLLKLGKYPTWRNILEKKGLRILLPYFVFGIFFMATTGEWHPFRLFNGMYWHLWFLPMLFWCFVVGYAVCRAKFHYYVELLLLLFAFIGTISHLSIIRWMGIQCITGWFYWFYLGMLCYKYHDTLSSYVSNKLSILLLILAIAVIALFPVKYGDSTWYGNLAVTCCIVSISCLMSVIDWNKFKVTSPIVKFSAYSFGIYIWHNWVALMLISNTSKQIFGLPELAANHVILFPLCFSLITVAISWGISWCMLKTKIGKFLIG